MDVLKAFNGSKPLFEVFRDERNVARPLWLTGRVVADGASTITDSPDNDLLDSVDRIVFYEQSANATDATGQTGPVLELPFIPGSVRLKLVGNHPQNRRVTIQHALTRCFLKYHSGGTRPETALFEATLALGLPDPFTGDSRVVFPRRSARWHGEAACSNRDDVPLDRASIQTGFTFALDVRWDDVGLGGVFGLAPTPWRGRWTAGAFDADPADPAVPLQLQFALTNTGMQMYRFERAGLPGLILPVEKPLWRQRPAVPVSRWLDGPDGRPSWRVELSLPGVTAGLLAYYNTHVAGPVHRGLRVVREGQPLSLLPLLTEYYHEGEVAHPMKPDSWSASVRIDGEWARNEPDPYAYTARPLDWEKDFEGRGAFRLKFGRLQPDSLPPDDPTANATSPDADHALLAYATFPCFSTTLPGNDGRAQPLILPVLVHGADPAASGSLDDDFGDGMEVVLAITPAEHASTFPLLVGNTYETTGLNVRLGALEIACGSPVVPDPKTPVPYQSAVETAPILRFSQRFDPIAGPAPVVSEFQLYLGIWAVGPAGQDALPGEEFAELFESNGRTDEDRRYERAFAREAPLVLGFPTAADALALPAKPPYRLDVNESVLNAKSQTVDLRLSQPELDAGKPAGQTQRLWIIDRDPFLIAEVRFADFLSDLTTEIANFSTRSGAAWEMSAGSTGFDLVLPPQGVGEAMEKNRGSEDGQPEDINEDQLAAYRFTPPAVLRVQPAYYQQRFAEPPWNLRRLLGYPGQRDPGMTVERMEFELFYGLAARVERDDLRLAEIAARLGAVPGRQPKTPLWNASKVQTKVFARHRQRWAEWYRLLLGRLAILEPWRDGQQDRDLALTDGVHYSARRTARMKLPVNLPPDAAGRLDVPARTYLPSADQSVEAPGAPLPGGLAWPFDSLNLYNLLWRTPEADAGELHRPYFSSLGGSGFQKATFAGGQLRIYTDTAIGRTHAVTLEVLGRISIGWHLAKLVIVYERSVLPTRQFFNETYREQDALRGRPVLRKVEEYVEILEPSRPFNAGVAAPAEAGCLHGIEFPEGARRIKVTSRWGEDVGTPNSAADLAEGWKVPLWVRGAQPEDVYPKPQIVSVFAPAQGIAPARIEFDEPEKLYFFTNTKPGRVLDPHDWPAVQGIDFGWHPEHSIKPTAVPDRWKSGGLTDANAEPDPAVKTGLAPFTFALRPSSHAVNLTEGRNAQAHGAMLQNVTLMRGYAPPANPIDAATEKMMRLRDGLGVGAAAARASIGRTNTAITANSDARDAAAATLEAFRAAVQKVSDQLAANGTITVPMIPEPGALCDRLQSQVRGALTPLRASVLALEQNFSRKVAVAGDLVLADLAAAKGRLVDEIAHLESQARAQVNQFTALLDPVRAAKDRIFAGADATAREALATLDEFLLEVRALPDPWPAAAVVWDDQVGLWRMARDLVRAARTGVDNAVGEAARPWTGALPDGFRVNLSGLATALDGAIGALAVPSLVAIEQALADGDQARYEAARETLLNEISAVRNALDAAWTALRNAADAILTDILNHVTSLRDAMRAKLESALTALHQQLDPLANLADPADFKRQLTDALQEADARWDAGLQQAEDAAVGCIEQNHLCERFFAGAQEYLDYLRGFLDDNRIRQWIDDALSHSPSAAELREQLERFERDLSEAVKGLVGRVSGAGAGVLGELAKPAVAVGDAVGRLVRAFGSAPSVPSLDFRLPGFDAGGITDRLPDIGYYFHNLVDAKNLVPLPHVDLTPVLAFANGLGRDVLNGLEIKLPTTQLLDRFKPFALPNFNLRDIFPNFAGLKLDDLFESLKLPEGANDHVKITHGVDPQSLSGWAQIEVDQPFGDAITMFSFAGLVMQIENGRFQAVSRIEAGAGQAPKQTFQGAVSGNWELAVGGFLLVTIEDTALRFDDGGRILFDVRPDKVRLPGPMSFLADLISRFNFGDKGFTFKASPEGALVSLNLPLPDIQGGAFGLANLSLGFFLELSVVGGFVLSGGVNVASRQAPFTLTVFILGGAGWMDFRFRYAPKSKELSATVSIGIMASASLAISVGPISGGIYAYFGITVDYAARRGAGSDITVALVLRFVGQVSLLGIVSVYLELGLTAQYSSGGGLVGRGYVRAEIKICWCFTLKVSASVSYTFGGAGGSSSQLFGGPAPAALGALPQARRSPLMVPVAPRGVAAAEDVAAPAAAWKRPTYREAARAYVGMFA